MKLLKIIKQNLIQLVQNSSKGFKVCLMSLIITISYFNTYSQMLDDDLKPYIKQVNDAMIYFGEIDTNNIPSSSINDFIYSRKLWSINANINYYVIGVTASHSYEYIAVLCNDSLCVLETKVLSSDIEKLFYPLGENNYLLDSQSLLSFIKNIKEVYDKNNSPSWKMNINFIKE